MKLGFCGPLTNIFFNWMDTSFRNQVFFEYNPDILEHAESLLTHNSSRSDFLSNWANATRNVSSSSWAGMTISKNNASEIAMSKASLLWNASVAYSLLNQTLNSTQTWYMACEESNQRTEARDLLRTQFNLTVTELDVILHWVNSSSYRKNWQEPFLLSKFQINEVSDLSFLQWGSCSVTKTKQSVAGYYLNLPWWVAEENAFPEYGCWARDTLPTVYYLNVSESRRFLNGTWGTFNMQNMGYFLQNLTLASNISLFERTWGLNRSNYVDVGSFFSLQFMQSYTGPYLQREVFSQGGGLITSHSVRDWVFGAQDALLKYAQPDQDVIQFMPNYTSPSAGPLYW